MSFEKLSIAAIGIVIALVVSSAVAVKVAHTMHAYQAGIERGL